MKKLLSLLAVCSFAIVGSTSVVACTSKPQEPVEDTNPKEIIAKYNQDFKARVETKVFGVQEETTKTEELTQQIKDLITIVSGENKEVKFDFKLDFEKDDIFNLNYSIELEKESKILDSESFSIEKQTYVFRTQLDDINEEFNKILLAHEFDVQDISDIDISNVTKLFLKIITTVGKIQTEFANTFKELNKENVEISDAKIHLVLDEQDILLANPDLNKVLEEGIINLPAFVKYNLKDNKNNKVYLSEKLEFSFKIPKIDLGTFKADNKHKLVKGAFSSINLDKANEKLSQSLVDHSFQGNIEEIDMSDLLGILDKVFSVIQDINTEIAAEFNNLKLDNVLIDDIKIALNVNLLDILNINKWSITNPDQIIKDIKEKGIILPFVASYTLNDKLYFADNLKAQIKINLPE